MDSILPSEVDILIIGTGLYESILSSACSCIGLKVLHVDSNSFYGGVHTSLSLLSLRDRIDNILDCEKSKNSENIIRVNDLSSSNEQNRQKILPLKCDSVIPMNDINFDENFERFLNTSDSTKSRTITNNIDSPNIETNDLTTCILKGQSRLYSLDVTPKLIMAGTKFFELLIRSTTCRYLEFQRISKILTTISNNINSNNDKIKGNIDDKIPPCQNEVIQVPCTRSQIFRSQMLTMVEKRLLMKFLSLIIMDKSEINDNSDKLLLNAFQSLTPRLKLILCQAIALRPLPMNQNTLPQGFIQNVKNYCLGIQEMAQRTENSLASSIESTNDFDKNTLSEQNISPFLYPLYGCGEMSQAFCRLSAVHGPQTSFVLNARIDGLILPEENELNMESSKPDTFAQNSISDQPKPNTTTESHPNHPIAIINGQSVQFKHAFIEEKYKNSCLSKIPFLAEESELNCKCKCLRSIFVTNSKLPLLAEYCDKTSSTQSDTCFNNMSFLHTYLPVSTLYTTKDLEVIFNSHDSLQNFDTLFNFAIFDVSLIEICDIAQCGPKSHFIYHFIVTITNSTVEIMKNCPLTILLNHFTSQNICQRILTYLFPHSFANFAQNDEILINEITTDDSEKIFPLITKIEWAIYFTCPITKTYYYDPTFKNTPAEKNPAKNCLNKFTKHVSWIPGPYTQIIPCAINKANEEITVVPNNNNVFMYENEHLDYIQHLFEDVVENKLTAYANIDGLRPIATNVRNIFRFSLEQALTQTRQASGDPDKARRSDPQNNID